MLSGLFKRKEKKGKQDTEIEETEKTPEESPRMSPTPKDSVEGLIQDSRPPNQSRSPQRQPSKLQKQPPLTSSPKTSPTKDAQQNIASPQGSDSSYSMVQSNSAGSTTLRQVAPETQSIEEPQPLNIQTSTPKAPVNFPQSEQLSASTKAGEAEAPADQLEKPIGTAAPTTPEQNPFATEESEDEDDIPSIAKHSTENTSSTSGKERLSESPVHISPIESNVTNKFPSHPITRPPLMVVTSSSKPHSATQSSPTESSSSASLVEAETPRDNDQSTDRTTTSPHAATPSTTRSTPSWSDASLRTYMDDDSDIRDLLIIVHDKSNVIPAGPEHPVTGQLFNAEKTRLAEMQSNLDSMLTGWLARKSRSRVSSTA